MASVWKLVRRAFLHESFLEIQLQISISEYSLYNLVTPILNYWYQLKFFIKFSSTWYCFICWLSLILLSFQSQLLSVFEMRFFHLSGYLFGKAHGPLNQNKIYKNQLWVWCYWYSFSGSCLFCNSNRTKSPFPDIFERNFFSYVLPRLIISLLNKFLNSLN